METRNLAPWNWFKNSNISSALKEENSLWENSNRRIRHIFEDFIKDFGGSENFLPTFFKSSLGTSLRVLPRVDISDTDKEYIVEAELPGVKEADLDVSFSKDGMLIIKGKRESKEEQNKRNYYRVERSYGSFERSVFLPENCDPSKIDASFQDGILSVKILKKVPTIGETKKIKINQK